jgi:hypothetical protein
MIYNLRVIQFSEPSGPQLKFDPPSSESFGDLPLIRDPFEEKFIKVGPSGVVEAGCFLAFFIFMLEFQQLFSRRRSLCS